MDKPGRERVKGSQSVFQRKSILRIIVILLVMIIVVVMLGLFGYRSILARIPRTEDAQSDAVSISVPPLSDDGIINALLIGQSARPGEDYHMADTVMLVTVNKNTNTITLTSFLRDTYLQIPDYTDLSGNFHPGSMQRLNICYHLGHSYGTIADAMGLLNQCLYENFGVEVDFNIEVGFDGVEKIVDYFGGIEVELTEEEAEYLNADDLYVLYDVYPGKQILNGTAALSYARMRNAEGDGGSDIKRTSRQRIVLEKLMDRVKEMDSAALPYMIKDFLPYIVTNMTDEQITGCVLEILPLVQDLRIETATCPAQSTYWGEIMGIGGFDSAVLRYDEDENRRIMKALTEGE